MNTIDPTQQQPEPRIHVLVADDHVTVLEGLAAIIDRQPDMRVVAQAANGREAAEQWRVHRPDVAVLDIRMPEMDGVDAIEAIRQLDPSARILMLTTFDTDTDIARAIRAGAHGFLLKDSPREELLAAIRRVDAGETVIPPALVNKLAAGISTEALTGRELEVLRLLAEGRSNKEIGNQLYISQSTVKSHLRSIFNKLNVLSRTEAIAVATRRGLLTH
ncbi:response regulator transcription factor [Azoarcus sp. L1K30]|uniref:response regulator n=1 Tax=Azoarcus sp. L1K30 TaxID=2820277 RepID=UPI001B83300F|nr:response regulator transcription factor [Azoarcus sp. L1K30]MBR0566044.1 response regulator transcription factor [Azoarcus sp. L1K30]